MGVRLIGLVGPARVGKDTAGEGFQSCGWARLAFADPLKRIYAATINGYLEGKWWWRVLLRLRFVRPLTVEASNTARGRKRHRRGWVALGASARAELPEVWVYIGRRAWRLADADGRDVVLTDCRYLNELQTLVADGGVWCMVVRPGYGPANDEERRSLNEIGDAVRDGRLPPPVKTFDNVGDTPAALVEQVEAWLAGDLFKEAEG